jgi:hypothetical protein
MQKILNAVLLGAVLVAFANVTAARPTSVDAAAGKPQKSDDTPPQVTVEQHEAAMKRISSLSAAVRMKAMENELDGAAKDAQELATLFGDVERFWAQRGKADAVRFAQEGRRAATDTAGAAGAGDQAKAQVAANAIAGACKQCHALYREGDAQTGYRIKTGVLAP